MGPVRDSPRSVADPRAGRPDATLNRLSAPRRASPPGQPLRRQHPCAEHERERGEHGARDAGALRIAPPASAASARTEANIGGARNHSPSGPVDGDAAISHCAAAVATSGRRPARPRGARGSRTRRARAARRQQPGADESSAQHRRLAQEPGRAQPQPEQVRRASANAAASGAGAGRGGRRQRLAEQRLVEPRVEHERAEHQLRGDQRHSRRHLSCRPAHDADRGWQSGDRRARDPATAAARASPRPRRHAAAAAPRAPTAHTAPRPRSARRRLPARARRSWRPPARAARGRRQRRSPTAQERAEPASLPARTRARQRRDRQLGGVRAAERVGGQGRQRHPDALQLAQTLSTSVPSARVLAIGEPRHWSPAYWFARSRSPSSTHERGGSRWRSSSPLRSRRAPRRGSRASRRRPRTGAPRGRGASRGAHGCYSTPASTDPRSRTSPRARLDVHEQHVAVRRERRARELLLLAPGSR